MLTCDEASRLLKSIGVQLPPSPPPSQRHLDAIAKIKREHAEKTQALKAKSDARIAEAERHRQELIAESQLSKRLLREQRLLEYSETDRVEIAQRQGFRRFIEQIGTTLGDVEKRQLDDELTGAIDESATPAVRMMSRWLADIWQVESIDVRDCRDPRIANGSASREGRWITVALPIKNLRLATIAGHETAHLLHPEVADAREVTDTDGTHKISVPHEIASWTWLLEHTPVWTESMHSDMKRFLNSYRPYATDDEKRAIDWLSSQVSFFGVRLRIAEGQ
jgi:hypothetical protein